MGLLSRAKQRGSVVPFFVVMVILVAGLTSAMYFVKQHGEQVRKEQAIATYNQQQTDKKAAESKKTDKTSVAKTDDNKTSNNAFIADNSSSELPVTGPKLAMSELSGLFLLTMATTSYLMSCRSLRHSL